MKIKLLLNLTIVAFIIVFVACNDNLDSIGGNIQPNGDDISVSVDTVTLTAKTISLKDSVYARTSTGMLGEYIDPIFGKIKSDFLSELYCPENLSFHPKTIPNSIDSVFLDIVSYSFYGDSISPVGVAVYRVDKKNLDRNFFTNIKPTEYCSMKDVIGQGIFSVKDAEKYSTTGKKYRISVKNSLGNEFYTQWKADTTVFKNSTNLSKFFKGIYVTSTLGSGILIDVNTSILQIYYRYMGRNKANTADSTYVGMLRLATTGEVLQLNQIQNSTPSALLNNNDSLAYLKSPAGVCTELTIPLKEIIEKAKKDGTTYKINSAMFKLKGHTEEEAKSKLLRNSNLLFLNKDSLADFFTKGHMANATTSLIMIRDTTSNTYNFSYSNIATSVSNNLASMINHYIDYYKEKDSIPDLKYLVIPVLTGYQYVTSSSYTQVKQYSSVFNQMSPTSGILRTDKKNMKMSLIFSNYNNSAK